MLGEVEVTLASLGRPGGGRVCDLWLFATKVGVELLVWDGFVAEPEVLLGELEAPVMSLVKLRCASEKHALQLT